MKAVCIIIVTRNRLECLKRAVRAALSEPLADLLVVDNASTDGTREWLSAQADFDVLETGGNLGGAGGFAAGMRRAYDRGYEWLWVMDDDVMPLPGGAAVLLKYGEIAPSVQPTKLDAKGRVFEFEGLIHPKSFRRSRLTHAKVFGGRDWVECTTANFEGMFIHRRVIDAVGFPEAEFFLAWDDAYYGWKVSRRMKNIYVREACVRKQFDKEAVVIGGKRLFSSTLFGRFFHLRNFMRVIRLERLGARAYLQYGYEWTKAAVLTVFLEGDVRGVIWLVRAAAIGWSGKDLAPSTRRFLEAR